MNAHQLEQWEQAVGPDDTVICRGDISVACEGEVAEIWRATARGLPEMEFDRINVDVPYLGAAPEEVEEAVNVRIEKRSRASTASSRSSRPRPRGWAR